MILYFVKFQHVPITSRSEAMYWLKFVYVITEQRHESSFFNISKLSCLGNKSTLGKKQLFHWKGLAQLLQQKQLFHWKGRAQLLQQQKNKFRASLVRVLPPARRLSQLHLPPRWANPGLFLSIEYNWIPGFRVSVGSDLGHSSFEGQLKKSHRLVNA